MGPLQIVWFKRDLRLADHRPLSEASRDGPVLPLYVVEPELWLQPDSSARQWRFCRESLLELRVALSTLGQPLVVRIGEVDEVLERVRRSCGIAALWSHEETGNGFTYARDRRVAAWARNHGIPWHERSQFGVTRRLGERQGWARRWESRMAEALTPAPPRLEPLEGIDPGVIPAVERLGLAADSCPGRQRGGRRAGLELLESFLAQRSRRYASGMSSPATAPASCSRLSPHLSWGTLSMREVVQRTRARRDELAGQTQAVAWRRSLLRFDERLHWHCHFIQKLESQPGLEFRELHPLTAGLEHRDPERLAAWSEGRTGLPFVDACMRSLIATGWLNFRMRAMLMSVASHHLRLPWRESGLHLARLFLDYEPGIHWSQVQMQSGTTGINTIRIYNPIKQGRDHDPDGLFLRRWLPELEAVPAVYLHEPWTLDAASLERLGWGEQRAYPLPIVDPVAAAAEARERLWALRRHPDFEATAAAIQERHGSRRSGLSRSDSRRRGPGRGRSGRADSAATQLSLDLG
jgi:deoxyribodipyrimidine photo-lyase